MGTSVLGVDWSPEMATEFADDFDDATISHVASTSRDPLALSGPVVQSKTSHTCKAQSFAYERRFVDGSTVIEGDVQVMVLKGTVSPAVVVAPGDTIAVPLPGASSTSTVRIVAIIASTEAFVTVQARGVGL